MLDFTSDSPRHLLDNEMISREEPSKTARTPVDRRQSTATVSRKRRRDDGLYNGKRTPLGW